MPNWRSSSEIAHPVGSRARNPDVALEVDIKDISARSGGNIRLGLFIRATAK